jgi:TctA family transporter
MLRRRLLAYLIAAAMAAVSQTLVAVLDLGRPAAYGVYFIALMIAIVAGGLIMEGIRPGRGTSGPEALTQQPGTRRT